MSRGIELSTEQQMAKRDALINRLDEELDEFRLPVRDDSDVRYWFYHHMDIWIKETAYLSDVHRIVNHGSYQRIIGLGYQVLPLIFEQLSYKSGHWFWALSAIVGEDIARDAKTTLEAQQMWLTWAQQEKLVLRKSGSHEEK